MVIPSLSGGGAERVVLRLSRALIERGHAVDLLLFQPTVAYRSEIPSGARLFLVRGAEDDGKPPDSNLFTDIFRPEYPPLAIWRFCVGAHGFQTFPLPLAKGFKLASACKSALEQTQPDIVISHLRHAKLATQIARQLMSRPPPVIPVLHNNVSGRRRSRIRRLRAVLPSANRIVAVANGVADDASQALDIPRERITAIHNPVPVEHVLSRSQEQPDHPWFSDGGPPIILGVGRISRQKEFQTLIRAVAVARATRPCRLIVLGTGPSRWVNRLVQTAREAGIEESISLPGFAANPFSYMRCAAVFALSSKHEGLPTVLIEALACGCPSVSTDCPYGPSEILADGKFGRLVPVGDPDALGQAILDTLEAPPPRQLLVDRAKSFGVAAATDAWEQLIERTIREAQDSAPKSRPPG